MEQEDDAEVIDDGDVGTNGFLSSTIGADDDDDDNRSRRQVATTRPHRSTVIEKTTRTPVMLNMHFFINYPSLFERNSN